MELSLLSFRLIFELLQAASSAGVQCADACVVCVCAHARWTGLPLISHSMSTANQVYLQTPFHKGIGGALNCFVYRRILLLRFTRVTQNHICSANQ